VTSRCWQGFYFRGPNGNVIYAVQADTGSGGGNVGPYPRTFDFFASAATEIGITSSMGRHQSNTPSATAGCAERQLACAIDSPDDRDLNTRRSVRGKKKPSTT
jgi:hypothetical protein